MTAAHRDDRRAAFELLSEIFCPNDPQASQVVDECLLAERDNARYCERFGADLAEIGVLNPALVCDAWRAFLIALRRRGWLASLDWSFGVDDVLFNFDHACERWLPGVSVRWSWRTDPELQSWMASRLLPKVAGSLFEHGRVLIELVTGGDDVACVTIANDASVSFEAIEHIVASLGRRSRRIDPVGRASQSR